MTHRFTSASGVVVHVGGGVGFDYDGTNFANDGIINTISGTTITITGDFSTYAEGDTITFHDPSLIEFETFVNTWLENCGACEEMTPYNCPSTCI